MRPNPNTELFNIDNAIDFIDQSDLDEVLIKEKRITDRFGFKLSRVSDGVDNTYKGFIEKYFLLYMALLKVIDQEFLKVPFTDQSSKDHVKDHFLGLIDKVPDALLGYIKKREKISLTLEQSNTFLSQLVSNLESFTQHMDERVQRVFSSIEEDFIAKFEDKLSSEEEFHKEVFEIVKKWVDEKNDRMYEASCHAKAELDKLRDIHEDMSLEGLSEESHHNIEQRDGFVFSEYSKYSVPLLLLVELDLLLDKEDRSFEHLLEERNTLRLFYLSEIPSVLTAFERSFERANRLVFAINQITKTHTKPSKG